MATKTIRHIFRLGGGKRGINPDGVFRGTGPPASDGVMELTLKKEDQDPGGVIELVHPEDPTKPLVELHPPDHMVSCEYNPK